MAQNNRTKDPEQIVAEAAETILAGESPDNLSQAGGWATKLAVNEGAENELKLSILVRAGQLEAALHLLVKMSFGDNEPTTASTVDDPLDDLLDGGSPAARPQPAPVPTKPVVKSTAKPVAANRRAQRPVPGKNN